MTLLQILALIVAAFWCAQVVAVAAVGFRARQSRPARVRS
jgi:uncharacterized membrane-anchored protein